jgi:predicted ribosome quality control (RQC) complex YloA/Tae2 family protein
VSNAIRYDALLVRDLAAELNGALSGARMDAAHLERDALRVTLLTRAARRSDPSPPSLQWRLHPDSGHLTTAPGTPAGGRVQLRAPSAITRVFAPPDERMIVFELDAGDAPAGIARRIIVELMTNQWNAIAVGADDRITAVLRERTAKERQLRAGIGYVPPPSSGRPGAEAPLPLRTWIDALQSVKTGERLRAVLRFAYVSPLNAAAIIGDADVTDDIQALERAHGRYIGMVWTAPREPVLMLHQPYSVRIEAAVPMTSLLDAFAAATTQATTARPTADTDADAALARIAERFEALDKRASRLRREQQGAAREAEVTRHRADVLMTQLHQVPRGAASVELQDFDGTRIIIELDTTLDAPRNAARLYDSARRRDRAAARIPDLLQQVVADRARLEALAARIRAGIATPEEMAALLRTRARGQKDDAVRLPYREYRTSRGTEVRVGRGARANDALTFRHASSTDIWLHARDVAGAHVILRWPHAEQNPPAADITEAAVLAALYSRARTSSTVAVDWTRRKYVRKPRKAAPGAVIPERVKTVFVQPDTDIEERLRVQD